MPSAYRELLSSLSRSLNAYREGTLALADLKGHIWQVAETITLREERELRTKLQWAEAELDTLQFTVNSGDVYRATLGVVAELERIVTESLG